MKAVIGDTVLAESDDTVVVEGNHYFPPESLHTEFFKDSETTSECPWKGHANYYHVVVGDTEYKDVAWVYKDPKDKAAEIKDHVAFWRDVEVVE